MLEKRKRIIYISSGQDRRAAKANLESLLDENETAPRSITTGAIFSKRCREDVELALKVS